MKRAMALVTLGILLSGCGQKGPLYLPSTETAQDTLTVQQEQKNILAAETTALSQGGLGG